MGLTNTAGSLGGGGGGGAVRLLVEVLGGEAPLNIKWITLEKFQIDKSRGLEYLSNDNSIKERLQMEISTKKIYMRLSFKT